MARRRKRRTPAQKRATRRLVAMNRRRRNPNNNRRRAPARRRPTMRTYVANPRRRRKARRRNPSGGRMTMRNVMNRNVVPAFQGAAGGLALDVMWGYLPIPVQFKTGMMRHIIKGGGAIVMGMIAQNLVRPGTAHALTNGALTTVMHAAMRETVAQFMPNVPLGEYMEGMGYYSAGQITSPQMGQVPYGTPLTPMGEYMTDDNMGYYETGVEGDMMGMGVGVYE